MKSGPGAGLLSLLKNGQSIARAAGARRIALGLAAQILIALVALPLIHWLFKEALRASGMNGVNVGDVTVGPGWPLSLLLIAVLALLALWILVNQLAATFILLGNPHVTLAQFLRENWRTSKGVLKPSSAVFGLYLFIIVPLSGFGFVSQLTRGIAIPRFITGELEKVPAMNVLLIVLSLAVLYLNVRLAFSLPLFVTSNRSGWAALKGSWQVTRSWRTIWFVAAVVVLLGLATGLLWILMNVLLLPTWLADTWLPQIAAPVAAYSFGVGQALVMIVLSLVVGLMAGIMLAFLQAEGIWEPTLSTKAAEEGDSFAADAGHTKGSRAFVSATTLLVIVVTGTTMLPVMSSLQDHPATLILGHRGALGEVENSIEALELAVTMNPDLVEIDVMQTKDKEYVVIHDPNLKRLAGKDVDIKDLTLAEATDTEIHDSDGNVATIPSLLDYGKRAKELGMPLLIEIKLSGAEGPNHVQELLDFLDEHDLYEGNLFHSLDEDSVNTLKYLRPDATVGYLMPVAGFGVPDNAADLLGVEEWTASDKFHARVTDAGKGFYVWTVDDPHNIKDRIVRGVDGIITDYPDKAVAAREDLTKDVGLTPKLADLLYSFVTVF